MVTTTELAWTAGFLESRVGTFDFTDAPLVMALRADREPIDRLARWYGGDIRRHQDLDRYQWILTGSDAIGLMMTLYPMMSPRRRAQIDSAIRHWRG
jgi:hypothetical protein